ncbi:hypothetical protein Tco_0507674 [Tanacetum coccineum]
MLPLRSDTIRLVQNGCSFHGLRSEDPNQHLKDFLKLLDSLDFDVAKGKGCACVYFNFPFVIKLATGLNVFQQDPSPHERILLLVSLLDSFHREGLQNSAMTSRCSNNIKESLFLKHGLISKTYSKKQTIDQSAGGKVRDRNAEESWALLEDLALYDNESWNDPRDFAKLVKAISLPQDVPMNKITSSCEICSGPHDTQYCMENPEQARAKQPWRDDHIDTVLKVITDRITGALPSDTVKNPKLNVNSTSPVLSARDTDEDHHAMVKVESEHKKSEEEEGNTENIKSPSQSDPSISFITKRVRKLNSFLESSSLYDDSHEEELRENENAATGGLEVEYFDTFPTRSELAYHKYLICGPIPSLFLRNPIIAKGYFMIVEDISSIIDPRLLQVVLGKPFVEISNMTHDLSLRVVKFTDGINEIAYKMPHKIEQYNSLLDLEKEHTKSVYLRNKEDKRRGVEYAMSKILGFCKECLELGPEYLTGVADGGGATPLRTLQIQSLMTLRIQSLTTLVLGDFANSVLDDFASSVPDDFSPWNLSFRDLLGTNTNPQDSKRLKQLADMGLPSTSKDGIYESKSLPEGKTTDPQDFSDEEIFEAGDKMETNLPHATKEHFWTPSFTDKVIPSNEHHSPLKEIISTRHQSQTAKVSQPESSKTKRLITP